MISFFLFSVKNTTENWICLHCPGSLVSKLSPHANAAWEWGYPPGVSSCTWLVIFDLKIFPWMHTLSLASWWERGGLEDLITCSERCHVAWLKVDAVSGPTINSALISVPSVFEWWHEYILRSSPRAQPPDWQSEFMSSLSSAKWVAERYSWSGKETSR